MKYRYRLLSRQKNYAIGDQVRVLRSDGVVYNDAYVKGFSCGGGKSALRVRLSMFGDIVTIDLRRIEN